MTMLLYNAGKGVTNCLKMAYILMQLQFKRSGKSPTWTRVIFPDLKFCINKKLSSMEGFLIKY